MFFQITLAEQWQKVVLLSGQLMSDSLQPQGLQHASLPCPSLSPRVCSNSCPLSEWCYLTILSFAIPFSFFSIFPSITVFFSKWALHIRWPKYWNFSISPSNEYSGLISLKDWLVWSHCSPRDPQEASPTPQFKSINFLALNFLYSPTLTSIHDHWKNRSFD